jgi:hypothetical protein
MSKGGSTININFRGGSGGGVQKNNYPSSSRSHGNIGSGESHGGSGNDGGGYGFSLTHMVMVVEDRVVKP